MRILKKAVLMLASAAMTISTGICIWGAEKTAGYTCTSENVQFCVGDDWSQIHQVLGKENQCKILTKYVNGERECCYRYKDCDIYVIQNEKKQFVIDAVVLKENAATQEGLKLGQTPDEVKKLYPNATELYGIYTAELGNTQIIIDCGVRNNKVVDISYRMTKK